MCRSNRIGLLTLSGCVLAVLGGAHAGHESQVRAAQREAAPLGAFLRRHGYTGVDIQRVGTGHLVVRAKINGKRSRFICDTGASSTFISPRLARQLDVELQDSDQEAAGIGGRGVKMKSARIESIEIDEWRESDMAVAVLSMRALNHAFREAGERTIDGVLGNDWLTRRDAIIDVPNLRLYIR